jgi:hypothetical protein
LAFQSESGSSFECSLDRRRVRRVHVATELLEPRRKPRFPVRATDAAGNVEEQAFNRREKARATRRAS